MGITFKEFTLEARVHTRRSKTAYERFFTNTCKYDRKVRLDFQRACCPHSQQLGTNGKCANTYGARWGSTSSGIHTFKPEKLQCYDARSRSWWYVKSSAKKAPSDWVQ